MRRWKKNVEQFVTSWPEEAGTVLKKAVEDRVAEDTGGDGMLSGGRNLGRAEVEMVGRGQAVTVQTAGSKAVWGILEIGALRHAVTAKQRSRNGQRLLRNPVRGRPTHVAFASSRAKQTWTQGIEIGSDAMQRVGDEMWMKVSS